MESIQSIINAFKSSKKTRKNWKELETAIKRWHRYNVQRHKARSKPLEPKVKMDPDRWKNHPYVHKI